jgi:hypothetical protein
MTPAPLNSTVQASWGISWGIQSSELDKHILKLCRAADKITDGVGAVKFVSEVVALGRQRRGYGCPSLACEVAFDGARPGLRGELAGMMGIYEPAPCPDELFTARVRLVHL